MDLSSAQFGIILVGGFLSGAMSSLCFVAIPAILDTALDDAHLRAQWARLYHYGHHVLPMMAVGTCLAHTLISYHKARDGLPWKSSLLAGVVTVSIAPFTWAFMLGTNSKLFRLGEKPQDEAQMARVRGLVVKWTWLHLARSMLPLIGAVIGVAGYNGW